MKNTRIIDLCNFAKRFVVDECGVVGDMIALYDRDGDETGGSAEGGISHNENHYHLTGLVGNAHPGSA